MPSRRTHRWITRKLLGRNYDAVHGFIDLPARWMPGKSHRKLFHSYTEAMLIGALVSDGDIKGAAAGLLHVYIDELSTSNPDLKKALETLAKIDSILNRPSTMTRRRRYRRRRNNSSF